MFVIIVLALIAVLALGTIFVGPSVGYLGLALLMIAVVVILVLATAHEETL